MQFFPLRLEVSEAVLSENACPIPSYDNQNKLLLFVAILDSYIKLTHDLHQLIHVSLEHKGRFPQLQTWEQGSSGLLRYDGDCSSRVQFHAQVIVIDYHWYHDWFR